MLGISRIYRFVKHVVVTLFTVFVLRKFLVSFKIISCSKFNDGFICV